MKQTAHPCHSVTVIIRCPCVVGGRKPPGLGGGFAGQGVAWHGQCVPAVANLHVDVPKVHERGNRGEGRPQPHRRPAGEQFQVHGQGKIKLDQVKKAPPAKKKNIFFNDVFFLLMFFFFNAIIHRAMEAEIVISW